MTKPTIAPQNPWDLTGREWDSLAAIAVVGSDKLAAKTMGVSPKTIEKHLHSARQKMAVDNRLLAVLHWDRFQRVAVPFTAD